jgi:O-antigen ligase
MADSLIVKYVYCLLSILQAWYRHSAFARIVDSLGKKLDMLLKSSSIVDLVSREGIFPRMWRSSKFYMLTNKVLNLPSQALRRIYSERKHIFEHSLFFKAVDVLLKRYHLLLAFCILIVIVFPDNRWYNIFATILALGLLVLFFIKTVTYEGYGFKIKNFDIYLILFIISVFLAEIFSLFPIESLRFLVFYINCFLLLLLLVSAIKTQEELSQVVTMLLAGITLTGLYGIWQKIVGVPVNLSQIDISLNEGMGGRIYSTMGNPNNYAEVLVLFLPFYAAMVLNSKTFLKKLLFIAMAIPPLASLMLTLSRSSWIGFAVALLVFTFLWNKKLLPVIVIAGVFCIPFLPLSIYRRILTIFNPNDSSASYRVRIYRTVWPMLKEYWYSGVGLGSDAFMNVVRKYHLYTGAVPPHSHNLLLQIWLEIGLIGVLSFIGYLIRLFKSSIKAIKSKRDPKAVNIVIAGISAIIGVMVISLAEYIWFYHRVMVLFWVVAGMLIAAIRLAKKESYD